MRTLTWSRDRVRIIDQIVLPDKCVYRTIRTVRQMWQAIRTLSIRGAPALGMAAAYGVVLGLKNPPRSPRARLRKLENIIAYLGTSRPTAVNLFWALERMRQCAVAHIEDTDRAFTRALRDEAARIVREDELQCRRIGTHGARVIRKGDNLLTHCNAGGLATAGYGTALGVLRAAHARGRKITVYVDETRPLLQGARLTAWELMREGIPVFLICDSMAGWLMKKGCITGVIVGADRIAKNGDTANKIGTYSLAVLARTHRIPFYVAAPLSTFDRNLPKGDDIQIEQRSAEEVRKVRGVSVSPKTVAVCNPAFDVTPGAFITAFITEKGIVRPPYRKNIRGIAFTG